MALIGTVIYGVKSNGDLHWYRHDGVEDGSGRWTAGAGGNRISGGWDIYNSVFSGRGGDSGVIYGIKPNGDLHWYRHDGWQDGTAKWTAGQGGNRISGGWGIYEAVFTGMLTHRRPPLGSSGADVFIGPIYGIKPIGDLHWYSHDGWRDGTPRWTAGEGGKKIGSGWEIYNTVFHGEPGVIYGIKPNGDLHWYRHDGWRDGTAAWTAGGGGKKIGSGWDIYDTVFSGPGGVIYGIKPNGDLHWYRHDGWQDGTAAWTAGEGGKKIGSGWDIYDTVFNGESLVRPPS